MSFGNMHNNWNCGVCGFQIMAMPGEQGPRHCPRCYKVNDAVIELDKVSMV